MNILSYCHAVNILSYFSMNGPHWKCLASASARHFQWVPTTYVFVEEKKNNNTFWQKKKSSYVELCLCPPTCGERDILFLVQILLALVLASDSCLTSVAQLDAPSDWRPGGRGFNPRRGLQHASVEIDHEIFSTVILSLPLIQEGQLSVSGERMWGRKTSTQTNKVGWHLFSLKHCY